MPAQRSQERMLSPAGGQAWQVERTRRSSCTTWPRMKINPRGSGNVRWLVEGLRIGLAVAAELPGAPARERLVARHLQGIEIDARVVREGIGRVQPHHHGYSSGPASS